jgi:hypothetical protein
VTVILLFLKTIAVFVCVAVVPVMLAAIGWSVICHLGVDFAVGATCRGWIMILGIWWLGSFLIAIQVAKSLHLFPFVKMADVSVSNGQTVDSAQ